MAVNHRAAAQSLARCAALLGTLAAAPLGDGAAADPATTHGFTYVTKMPKVAGKKLEDLAPREGDAGDAVRRSVLEQRSGNLLVRWHVARSTCTTDLLVAPFVVAIEYRSHPPRPSDAEAGALFAEVYVRDHDRRVRLYRDVAAAVLSDLTARFVPACPDT